MLRVVLLVILVVFLARAFWRLVDGVIEGMSGRTRATGAPLGRVQMARDPVCGTFVVPDRAMSLAEGRRQIYFCSADCRDKYRARIA